MFPSGRLIRGHKKSFSFWGVQSRRRVLQHLLRKREERKTSASSHPRRIERTHQNLFPSIIFPSPSAIGKNAQIISNNLKKLIFTFVPSLSISQFRIRLFDFYLRFSLSHVHAPCTYTFHIIFSTCNTPATYLHHRQAPPHVVPHPTTFQASSDSLPIHVGTILLTRYLTRIFLRTPPDKFVPTAFQSICK